MTLRQKDNFGPENDLFETVFVFFVAPFNEKRLHFVRMQPFCVVVKVLLYLRHRHVFYSYIGRIEVQYLSIRGRHTFH